MVAKMKNEGLSNKDIAKEFKINERTVRRDLQSAESLGFIDNEPEF
jgi:DNA-binding NarL/FixJ family response regulator